MKDFYIKMIDGERYLFRGERLKDVIDTIGNTLLYNRGFLELPNVLTCKCITINVNHIVSIEEDDEF